MPVRASTRFVKGETARSKSTSVRSNPFFVFPAVSLLLLVPCYWQSRIQAADLSSHIYNAWLAQLIGAGHGKGLILVPQTTNVLFDLVLSALFQAAGADAAQRIAVPAAVLVFVWGAFAFISTVSGGKAWDLMPALAILAYGWVFHSGFFNFYLGLGLSLSAATVAWNGGRRRVAIAGLIFALASLAHNLPVLWALAILAYAWTARRLTPRGRLWLFAGCLGGLAVLHVAIRRSVFSIWGPNQVLLGSGADQAWLFDDKYYVPMVGLALIFWILFVELVIAGGLRKVAASTSFRIWAVTAAMIAIVPTAITGHGWQAAFIADRMSLPAGVCVLAMLATVRLRPAERYGLIAVAAVFFGFLYRDTRILNTFEDRLQAAVAQLPPDQRVVSGIDDLYLHINALTHMMDRVCVGRCFSYANYEPSTGQFRIRLSGDSPLVVPTYVDSWRFQSGSYIVRERDLPLYQVNLDEAQQMQVRSLHAGESAAVTYWKALPDLF
jgi:hypothetical protein